MPKRKHIPTEEDAASLAFGNAISNAMRGRKPTSLEYVVKCYFCHHEHVSPYWDEIEEGIMACRELSPGWRQGKLDPAVNYEEGGRVPEWTGEWGT